MNAHRAAKQDCLLDPEIRRFSLMVQKAYERFGMGENPPVERAREIAEKVREPWTRGGPEMAETFEFRLPAAGKNLRIRFYVPAEPTDGQSLVYLHGGGWTLFSIDTHDRLMREYAQRASIRVIGVDYSLSPEARFPQAVHEVSAVMRWLHEQGPANGVDAGRLAIGGDSAGANLAIAACLLLRERAPELMPRGMLLNYGAFDAAASSAADDAETPSEYPLTHDEMKQFWLNYLRSERDAANPLANPILAELKGLPPALMIIAECDTLCAENLAMADRLRAAGVSVWPVVYPGATHGFLEAVSIAQVAGRALDDSAAWLREVLGA
jgi:acetyl esterase